MDLYFRLYEMLADRFPDAQRDRRDNVFIPCPWCGKEDRHFSFSPRGGHCFVCGGGGSLWAVAERLGLRLPDREVLDLRQRQRRSPLRQQAEPTSPKPAAPWMALGSADRSRARWPTPGAWPPGPRTSPSRLRPSSDTTSASRACPSGGLSGNWYWSSTYWLTVPLYAPAASGAGRAEPGRLVGLRGRNLDPHGKPKWISATGTSYVLWNLAGVRHGGAVWICENYVDAAWLMERHPHLDAVALGGAAHWREEWAAQLAARQPLFAVVALDNDLAGQARGSLGSQLRYARRTEGMPDMPLNGPKIANSLAEAGLPAHLLEWPDHAPAHADVGWLLEHEGEGCYYLTPLDTVRRAPLSQP